MNKEFKETINKRIDSLIRIRTESYNADHINEINETISLIMKMQDRILMLENVIDHFEKKYNDI